MQLLQRLGRSQTRVHVWQVCRPAGQVPEQVWHLVCMQACWLTGCIGQRVQGSGFRVQVPEEVSHLVCMQA